MVKQKEENPTEVLDNSAPFNMGLATLQRIHLVLLDIINVDKLTEAVPGMPNNNRLPLGIAQHTKYRLVKQLFMQSSALLKDQEVKKEIHDRIRKIKRAWTVLKKDRSGEYKIPKQVVEGQPFPTNAVFYGGAYSFEVEEQLDELIVFIQDKLQEDGNYFMPSRDDPGFALME